MKLNSRTKYIIAVLAGSLLTLCLLFGTAACGALQLPFRPPVSNDISDYGFDVLLDAISQRYIGTYDEEYIIVEAKRALIEALGDNWSYYLTAEEYSQYLESSDNTYQGIGVEVTLTDDPGGIEVTNVYDNSGAKAAGIVIGDVITAVDSQSLAGLTLTEVRSLIRRPIGDTAMLTVFRADGQYHEIPVEFSVIFQDPVSYEMLTGNSGQNIGYIRLRNFEGESANHFIEAVEDLVYRGAEALIFDVRSNNGGRVNEMTRMLDLLLPEGDIFISVDKSGEEHITRSDSSFIDLPAVVLVNTYSYSGAEYFTATLSEYGYAATVGEPTTGKNRMQSTFQLPDGSALHISTGMFLTPDRIDLFEQGGYTPDHIIVFTDEEMEKFYRGELDFDNDPQFQKALEILG